MPAGGARTRTVQRQDKRSKEAIRMAPVDPETRIGHIHLKVSNLERSVKFYTEALGFEIMQLWPGAAFLSFGGYHHHLGLNTWTSQGGPPAPRGSAGLYHFAILYPTRKELARALKRLLEHGVMLDGAADHGVSEALYLHDPDGNGIELYRDRDRSEWPLTPEGKLAMYNAPVDLEQLLREAD
jgi:catechol 2,3-dioxygenase